VASRLHRPDDEIDLSTNIHCYPLHSNPHATLIPPLCTVCNNFSVAGDLGISLHALMGLSNMNMMQLMINIAGIEL
jgi:hypothetical protein